MAIMVELTKLRGGNPGASLQEVLKTVGVSAENIQKGLKSFWTKFYGGSPLDEALETALGAAGLVGGDWLYARWSFFDTFLGINIDAKESGGGESLVSKAKEKAAETGAAGESIVAKAEEKAAEVVKVARRRMGSLKTDQLK